MYKYYISELDIKKINITKLNKIFETKYENNLILLSKKGKYELNNGDVLFYIINDNDKEDTIVRNYLEKYTLFISKLNFKKVYMDNIDNNCIEINIEKFIYKESDSINTRLIVEKVNNKINDVYIQSNLEYDNYSLKEDISYLLSKII